MSTRVLVVDDASLFRRIVSDALTGLPGVEVVGTAANGRQALARMAALNPDLITLDLEMPEMNGIEMLDAMRAKGSTPPVIMLSSHTVRGGQMTIRALTAGAFDFITKPDGPSPEQNLKHLRDGLRPLITALECRREVRNILQNPKPRTASASPEAAPVARVRRGPPIVLIGVSTGGPNALAQLMPGLPANLPAPVFIVQHMPPLFVDALAQRLASLSSIPVRQAQDGETARNGCVYLAPGGKQMKIVPGPKGEVVVRITDDPPENGCRPAVDYLFRSAAFNFPGRSVAAVLTGMGADGTEGMRMLRRTGSLNLAQDEASCVVYGMPREAVEAGVVDSVQPLDRMAAAIVRGVTEVRV